PERREAVLAATRRIESEPSLLGASGHVLTVGRRP
ncbi:MAG TPA: class I SAM-dependent methyltransferase, partial [Streptomyces sp.]|nr:class I SAM-dependent methyltransferase [Streptomyces sp.]